MFANRLHSCSGTSILMTCETAQTGMTTASIISAVARILCVSVEKWSSDQPWSLPATPPPGASTSAASRPNHNRNEARKANNSVSGAGGVETCFVVHSKMIQAWWARRLVRYFWRGWAHVARQLLKIPLQLITIILLRGKRSLAEKAP